MGPPVFKTGVGARAPRRVRFPSASAWRERGVNEEPTLHVDSPVLKQPLGKALPIESASGSPCSSTALEPIESRLMWDVQSVTRQLEAVYAEGLFDR